MHVDFKSLTHPGIQTLAPYQPAKPSAQVAKEQGITDIIKLAGNENAWGCSAKVLEALRGLSNHALAVYPLSQPHTLREQLAKHLGVTKDMITLSNGSDILVGLLLTCFALHQPKHVITHRYAFATYAVQANTLGIPIVITPTNDWHVDMNAILQACKPDTALI